jgi:hypothetical protein
MIAYEIKQDPIGSAAFESFKTYYPAEREAGEQDRSAVDYLQADLIKLE